MSDLWINVSSVADDVSPTTRTKNESKKKKKQRWRKHLEPNKHQWAEPSGSEPTPRPNGADSAPPPHRASTSRLHPPASAGGGAKAGDPRPHVDSRSSSCPGGVRATPGGVRATPGPSKTVAIDCEMVGAGAKGHISQLARCSIVSYDGDVVYDKFICPSAPVTDYRTRWSGIRRRDLVGATPYAQARKEILKLLVGKVVVGHAIHNDFKALGYAHPAALTRDTSRFPLLNHRAGLPQNQAASLKRLTKAIFNRDIQMGQRGHSSVEDAKATMELYRTVEVEWERTPTTKNPQTTEHTELPSR